MSKNIVAVSQVHTGPIPSAEEMIQYAKINPDLPQNIFDMAHAEQLHRFEMDKQQHLQTMKKMKANMLITCSGMVCSLFCVAMIMSASVICAIKGQSLPSALIGSGGIGLIVCAFVCGAKLKKE